MYLTLIISTLWAASVFLNYYIHHLINILYKYCISQQRTDCYISTKKDAFA